MNYCINLKKRKNKPFCNLINEEISFSRCQQCDKKEYKTKIIRNSSYSNLKSTKISKKRSFQENISLKNTKKVQKMKIKSKKLAKLERNRFSVFTDDDKCFVCKSTYQLTWNEIFRGRNRLKSMKYGFCLRMCLNCHSEKQEDIEFNDFWRKQSQLYFEKNIGSREDFLAEFRRNYLK